MKGHHTSNIWQGKISLKTRQIRWIGLTIASCETRQLFRTVVRSPSVRRYDW
jgi:hypothetical protein